MHCGVFCTRFLEYIILICAVFSLHVHCFPICKRPYLQAWHVLLIRGVVHGIYANTNERIARMIVRWILSPSIVWDIFPGKSSTAALLFSEQFCLILLLLHFRTKFRALQVILLHIVHSKDLCSGITISKIICSNITVYSGYEDQSFSSRCFFVQRRTVHVWVLFSCQEARAMFRSNPLMYRPDLARARNSVAIPVFL